MKIGITYGTYDYFHVGHENLIKRAKEKVDYLIVGVTSEHYDMSRGKLNVKQSLEERINGVKNSGYADLVIEEDYLGQKIDDIKKYNVNIFLIGDDWIGEFDYLKQYCDVKYLSRTPDISSTMLRSKENKIIKLGIIGTGRISSRFIKESKYVSGVTIQAILSKNINRAIEYAKQHDIPVGTNDYNDFFDHVDAVYIANEHGNHFESARLALSHKKHVLIEKPITLSSDEAKTLKHIAAIHNCVVIEAIKTAYCPAFKKLIEKVKSGCIGDVIDIYAVFSSLRLEPNSREIDFNRNGGALNEYGTYTLMPVVKLLGKPLYVKSNINKYGKVDGYTKINMEFPGNRFATVINGLSAKSEGILNISGTKGNIYVESPWWKTEEFFIKYEDQNRNEKVSYNFTGDGLRYEISEFINQINKNCTINSITIDESIIIQEIMDAVKLEMN